MSENNSDTVPTGSVTFMIVVARRQGRPHAAATTHVQHVPLQAALPAVPRLAPVEQQRRHGSVLVSGHPAVPQGSNGDGPESQDGLEGRNTGRQHLPTPTLTTAGPSRSTTKAQAPRSSRGMGSPDPRRLSMKNS